jgi:hypothetical protein
MIAGGWKRTERTETEKTAMTGRWKRFRAVGRENSLIEQRM